MTDLLWPGDERAAETFSDLAVLEAMAEVERAWLQALASSGEVNLDAEVAVGLITAADLEQVAERAEQTGTPVVPLLDLLRERLVERGHDEAASWLHRGLTSQDVVDTALVMSARATTEDLLEHLAGVLAAVERLDADLGDTPMIGRTLTQHALPITFGHKLAQWRRGMEDAREDLGALRFPAQLGGPVGLGLPSSGRAAEILGLEPAPAWHTVRTPLTRYADALVRTTDALGHLAGDVLVLARTEVGEVSEPAGRGGSSSMPHKQNPVLSVLVHRAALSAPQLGAQVHLAAAQSHDERPDGAWHTEWSALATLSRRALVAASQTVDLLTGLRVHPERMRAHVEESS